MGEVRASLIVAMTPARVIGVGNKLPWHLPADLKYFRDRTRGHAIIMGRRTYESIGRPLPDRTNIVVSGAGYLGAPPEVAVVPSLEAAWQSVRERAPQDTEPFVLGGARIYAAALAADQRPGVLEGFLGRIYITMVEADVAGDAWFPELGNQWQLKSEEFRSADEKNVHALRFQVYEKYS